MITDRSIQPSEEDEQAFRIAFLVAGFMQNKLSPAEHDELNGWVNEQEQNQLLFEQLTDETTLQQGLQQIKMTGTQAALQRVKKKIFPNNAARISAAPVIMLIKDVFL